MANKDLTMRSLAFTCRKIWSELREDEIFFQLNEFAFDNMNAAATYLHQRSVSERKAITALSIPYTYAYLVKDLFLFISVYFSNLRSIEVDVSKHQLFHPSVVQPKHTNAGLEDFARKRLCGYKEIERLVWIKTLERFKIKGFRARGKAALGTSTENLSWVGEYYDFEDENYERWDVEVDLEEKKLAMEEKSPRFEEKRRKWEEERERKQRQEALFEY
jgi:hypothetical protein